MRLAVYLLLCSLLAGCDGSNLELPPLDPFRLQVTSIERTVIEGDANGLTVSVQVVRRGGYVAPVELSVVDSDDMTPELTASFANTTLEADINTTTMLLTLAIGDAPLQPHQRDIEIQASDSSGFVRSLPLTVDVQPTDAPDVYLLIGQSNMVGFSGDGTKESLPGQLDEPNPRILQLNVSANDAFTQFTQASHYTDRNRNVADPLLILAEDPLHTPLITGETTKELDFIGLGLSFAKSALPHTTANIVLVPAAWSGSAFCVNPFVNAHWNPRPTTNPELGNTLMFDRAVTRANIALAETGGVLRGILWHQGETDANARCADSYENNINALVSRLRTDIDSDGRGRAWRTADANIPFVVGTMSKGADDRGDLSQFTPSKNIVDAVHRNVANQLAHAAFANADDLTPANGFPCGNTTCIHFGAAGLRELGARYYDALQNALIDP